MSILKLQRGVLTCMLGAIAAIAFIGATTRIR